jgi:hypothetical protein
MLQLNDRAPFERIACDRIKAARTALQTYYHVSGVPGLIIKGFGLDDWIYWHFYHNYT